MILDKIIKHKKIEVRRSKLKNPLSVLKTRVAELPTKKSVFLNALKKGRPVAVIAEIKRKSPSKGILRKNFNPAQIAREFEKSGASALSVLTDRKFFGGSPEILKQVRKAVRLPILRKDFILEEYQVWESRLMGADAILLIACLLSAGKLKSLGALAMRLGLDTLYEAHTAGDVEKILKARPKIIGINNRDLRTFHVDIQVTGKLARRLPKGVLVVSESGIQSQEDLAYLKKLGVKAVLVGESLMKEKNVGKALKKLLGTFRG